MILVSLSGGIGNQLFQYAAGRSLAIHNNTSLLLDASWFSRSQTNLTPRNLELTKFKLTKNLGNITSGLGSKALRIILSSLEMIPYSGFEFQSFAEREIFVFDDVFFNQPKNVFLNGFWQSWKYFSNISSVLANDLVFNSSLNINDLIVLQRIRESESVGIHVRRGDYILSGMQVCGIEYYTSSAEKIKNLLSNTRKLNFFVFSDDIDWAKKNLILPGNVEYVSHNDESNCVNDLVLLSSCKHNIIANSSFSWWAAWIGSLRTERRIVIAPEVWLHGKSVYDIDIYPQEWVVISS